MEWLEEFNDVEDKDLRTFLESKMGEHKDTKVNIAGNETPLIDLILDDIPSYGA